MAYSTSPLVSRLAFHVTSPQKSNHDCFWPYYAGHSHSYFDKKLHGLVEVVFVRQRDSVAKRHRMECETMLNPAQAPGAARSVG